MSQSKDEMIDSKKPKIGKKNYPRQIQNLKQQMDKRKQQRSNAIYNLANSKFQNALIVARQLMFTSQRIQRIWKEFNNELAEQFEQTHYFRTSKNKQHTQHMLDSVIICKVFLKSKKKDDILQIIQKIQIPQIEVIKPSQLTSKEAIIKYNQMKEIQARVCAALLSFIQVTKMEKLNQYTEKLFNTYISFVQKYYGQLQYATATYIFSDFLFQIKEYQKAFRMQQICLKIRKQNCLNQAYVDVLVNSAICLRQLGRVKQAIQRMKLAIQVCKDLKKNQSLNSTISQYYLFLAKLNLENADFHEAYKNYKIVYKLRSELESQDVKKIEVQCNLLYFYKMLQKVSAQNPEEHYNIKDRKQIQSNKKIAIQILKDMVENIFNRQQFTKFDEFNKKMAHLNLVVPQQFFNQLNSDQVQELNTLLTKLGSCSFQKGVSELAKCSFVQQKKIRQLLLSVNPMIDFSKYFY